MGVFRIILFAFLLMPLGTNLFAAAVNTPCTITGTPPQSNCDADLYCRDQGGAAGLRCASCNAATNNTHPKSDAGSIQIENCYVDCGNKDNFENGTWAPDAPRAQYNNACTWTNLSNLICNPDAHFGQMDPDVQDNVCVLNIKPCNIPNGTGEQAWDMAAYDWSDCYVTSCDSDSHHYFGGCIKNGQLCTHPQVGLESSGINGNAEWTCPWNGNGLACYDKSDCNKSNGNVNLDHGTASQVCYYTSGSGVNAVYSTNCRNSISACIAGYYSDTTITNPTDCVAVNRGYYSGNNLTTRTACPAGATTNTSIAATISECIYAGGNATRCGANGENCTRFCDSRGCFYLPTNVMY